jgi:hypothetical protein
MALPKLETPIYEMVLPSNNETIKFRPFLVKEHKILLTLVDTDSENIIKNLRNIIDVCTFNKLDVDSLPNYDIEYVFINLRAKSIGELVNVNLQCVCGKEKISTQINLNDVKVENKNNISNIIKINNNIVLQFKFPNFAQIMEVYNDSSAVKIFDLVSGCLEKVTQNNEVYTEFTNEEANEFISNLTKEEFTKVEDFFVNIPKVVYRGKAKCKNKECNKENDIIIQGIDHFFV